MPGGDYPLVKQGPDSPAVVCSSSRAPHRGLRSPPLLQHWPLLHLPTLADPGSARLPGVLAFRVGSAGRSSSSPCTGDGRERVFVEEG
ncbi:hypothetical protein ElyMa_000926700 [Elysia marginata]|uniref:Uncharacterized protein n=1 Tax=Elysia marginata TaxID=1093978 RepID=A0AAV4HB85_9GAST|nr:hypothetical protein ElyMa_000926700 [Elysia marginata]